MAKKLTRKLSRKQGIYTLGCAITCTSFMLPAYAQAAAEITPSEEYNDSNVTEAQAHQGNIIAIQGNLDSGKYRTAGDSDQAKSVADTLAAMEAQLKSQQEQIAVQSALIAKQQLALDSLLRANTADADLAIQRGSGASEAMFQSAPLLAGLQSASGSAPGSGAPRANTSLPNGPVGEAPPPEPAVETQVQALPEGQGVLTPAGTLAIDSAFDYTSSSTNRLVFRGFELVPGIQIGLIEASDARRDTVGTSMTLRYGITNRFEIEARVPALYRWDRIQVAQQRGESIVREIKLKERGIGDIEFAARYQLNRPTGQAPIWVANLRVKSNTGIGPFDVGYDEFGVATGLATGSGFWGIQPGINFLLPSDPAVIFGSVSYLYHVARNIGRTVGGAFIGRVDPGDAISANLGFGFSLNPRFSFSLGYKHSYIFPSVTTINNTIQRSDRAQVGAFTFGMSYRLTEKQSVNIGFDIGATADAPDLGVSLRFPLSFNLRR